MPAYFGAAAVEVQAIAARTFAVSNILSSHWQSTSAHVVDSVLSQVYNNSGTNTVATAAVMASRGTIILAENKPADIRYFSTSCGYTANCHEVWPGKPVDWLVSRPQFPGPPQDIDNEESFRDFIINPPAEAFDEGSAWFRWQFSVPASQLADMIEANLKSIFAANPDVLQRQDGGKFAAITEMPAEPLGELYDLVPVRRGAGGILIEIEVQGSLGVWRVSREYYIRLLLRPGGGQEPVSLLRHDGSRLQDFALLPSAFAFWDKERQGNKLVQLEFRGGGYGHGVGMSQYGVRELAARGWTAAEIIGHFFPGVELDNIYD
jgi:peptidoglycan hydrolase-like amidase